MQHPKIVKIEPIINILVSGTDASLEIIIVIPTIIPKQYTNY